MELSDGEERELATAGSTGDTPLGFEEALFGEIAQQVDQDMLGGDGSTGGGVADDALTIYSIEQLAVTCATAGAGAPLIVVQPAGEHWGAHPVRVSSSGESVLLALPPGRAAGERLPAAPSGGSASGRVLWQLELLASHCSRR